jgi:hypothetical protein
MPEEQSFKTQQLALELLKKADADGKLDKSIKAELVKLVGEKTRGKLGGIFGPSVKSDKLVDIKGRELDPEQKVQLFSALEARFKSKPDYYRRLKGVSITEVKKTLNANPSLMYSLAQMERTGGEPDIIAIGPDALIFGDCSYKSPNRRDLTYDQAVDMANEFGVNMMDEETYLAMCKMGEFDSSDCSWIATPPNIRESGKALTALHNNKGVLIFEDDAFFHTEEEGWRGVLKVPRI